MSEDSAIPPQAPRKCAGEGESINVWDAGTDQTITIGSIRGRFWEIDYRRYRDQIAGSFAQLSADRDQI